MDPPQRPDTTEPRPRCPTCIQFLALVASELVEVPTAIAESRAGSPDQVRSRPDHEHGHVRGPSPALVVEAPAGDTDG